MRRFERSEPKPIIRQDRLRDLQLLDLTSIARPGAFVTISVADETETKPWIKLREISLSKGTGGRRAGVWMLDAFWKDGVTDQEHDSAHILRLDLGGVELDMIYYGRTTITGWIAGHVDDFCVPTPDYEKLIQEHPETAICKECRKRDRTQAHHVMVPPGYYVPPPQPELYAQMVGRRVEIAIDRFEHDEED